MKYLLFIVLLVTVVITAGCVGGNPTTLHNDIIITKDISSMGLTINDVSPGKDQLGKETINYIGGCNTTSASFQIIKFSTIDGAKKTYQSYDSAPDGVGSKATINIGTEGYSEMDPGWNHVVVFRRGNIFAVIQSQNLEETKKCAEIVDNKLKQ